MDIPWPGCDAGLIGLQWGRCVKPLLFIWAVLAFALAHSPVRGETFTIDTGEWAPFVSQDLPGGGPLARIVSEALKAAGHEARFKFSPWRRQMLEMQGGKALATFPWVESEGFKSAAILCDMHFTQNEVLFFIKERLPGWDFAGLEELKRRKVGGALGYSYAELFDKAGVRVDYAPDVVKSFQKLFASRVDVVPENETVGWSLLAKHFPERMNEVAVSRTPLRVNATYFVVSRTHPGGAELERAFNEGLSLLRSSGRFQQILSEAGL